MKILLILIKFNRNVVTKFSICCMALIYDLTSFNIFWRCHAKCVAAHMYTEKYNYVIYTRMREIILQNRLKLITIIAERHINSLTWQSTAAAAATNVMKSACLLESWLTILVRHLRTTSYILWHFPFESKKKQRNKKLIFNNNTNRDVCWRFITSPTNCLIPYGQILNLRM